MIRITIAECVENVAKRTGSRIKRFNRIKRYITLSIVAAYLMFALILEITQ